MNTINQSSPSTTSAAADAASLQLNVDTLSQVSNDRQGESFLEGMGAMDFPILRVRGGGVPTPLRFSPSRVIR